MSSRREEVYLMGVFQNIVKDYSEKCIKCGKEAYEGIYCDECSDVFICSDCLKENPGIMKKTGRFKWVCVKH
jgi:hypothetical protein